MLRVMTFNIRYGTARDGRNSWDRRRAAVARVIRDAAPHLVGLQEALAFQNRYLEQQLPGYRWTGVGRDDGGAAGEHASLFYDATALRLVTSHTFWFSDTPDLPSRGWGNRCQRICTHARLYHPGWGRSFHAFNVHLDLSARIRIRSVKLLLSMIERHAGGEPVVVLGDFNCGPRSEPYRQLLEAGLRDSFWARPAEVSPLSLTFHNFKGHRLERFPRRVFTRMDWVLHDRQLAAEECGILDAKVDGRYPSDHYPVLASLSPADPDPGSSGAGL
jgi:endonuclease/exonuclease/phosphatase family metal-dependent hydrolase